MGVWQGWKQSHEAPQSYLSLKNKKKIDLEIVQSWPIPWTQLWDKDVLCRICNNIWIHVTYEDTKCECKLGFTSVLLGGGFQNDGQIWCNIHCHLLAYFRKILCVFFFLLSDEVTKLYFIRLNHPYTYEKYDIKLTENNAW